MHLKTIVIVIILIILHFSHLYGLEAIFPDFLVYHAYFPKPKGTGFNKLSKHVHVQSILY